MPEPVLIQPVESPVICKPYYEPDHSWEYDRTSGRAVKQPGHMPAAYYEYEGVRHHYEPDYLVSLRKGKTLILETKGEEDDQDRAKHQAARRWVTAINNWGRLGVWDFVVCRDPALIPRQLAQIGPHY